MNKNILRKKRLIVIVAFISVFFLIATATLIIFIQKLQAKFPRNLENEITITKEDIKNYAPKTHILFEDMIQESPDGNYFLYFTTKDMSMRESQIWLIQKDGKNHRLLDFGEEYRYITNPIWSPDSKSIAFIKVYPFELWVVTPELSIFEDKADMESLKFELIYSQSKEKENNILNPSLGYGGSTYLKWNANNEIEFEDNNSIPKKTYSVNVKTKMIYETKSITPTLKIDAPEQIKVNLQSQRDLKWGNNTLGTCEETIESGGCAVAAVSMLLDHWGIESNPDILNNWLIQNSNQGYFSGCDIRWNIVTNYAKGLKLNGAYFGERDTTRIDYELSKGNPVIIGFNKVEFTNLPHWALIVGKKDDEYIIRDPWSTDNNELKTLEDFGGKLDHVVVYGYSE